VGAKDAETKPSPPSESCGGIDTTKSNKSEGAGGHLPIDKQCGCKKAADESGVVKGGGRDKGGCW